MCTGKTFAFTSGTRPSTVHPRVHGEDRPHRRRLEGPHRFTPVCTGKTPRLSLAGRSITVHPRVHGEDADRDDLLNAGGRFTPVCTGKTRRPAEPRPSFSVHPRVHGEDVMSTTICSTTCGSPPCARGRPDPPDRGIVPIRFTPVCTGKTRGRGQRFFVRTVHPRVHGEDSAQSAESMTTVGSPPCARGRPWQKAPRASWRRFTPVCTGKTMCTTRATAGFTVHPRVHGEDLFIGTDGRRLHGSPPCARGRRSRRHRRADGFPVHPRVHGEDSMYMGGGRLGGGSPPCARGRHWKSTAFSWFWPAKAPRSLRTPPATCHGRESRTPAPCLPRTKARPNRP